MRSFLQQFELGGKLILLSALCAVLSLFFNWVQFFTIIANGFKQGAYVLLLVYVYPVAKILLHKKLKKKFGYIYAVIGILLSLSYISMQIIETEGIFYKAYGYGPLIFMLSCVLLAIGIWKYNDKEV